MDSKREILKARNDMIKAIFADAEKRSHSPYEERNLL